MQGRILNLKPRENSEFEDEYDTYVPKEGELRILANRNASCQYYFKGMAHCRDKVYNIKIRY